MDKAHYDAQGPGLVTWSDVGHLGPEADRMYGHRCAVRARAQAADLAPTVEPSDMPRGMDLRDREALAGFLAGGADFNVSMNAIALEMHQPEAYWRRARADMDPIINKAVSHAMSQDPKHPLVGRMMAVNTFLGRGEDGFVEKGNPQAFNQFAGMLMEPGILEEDGGVLDEKDRRTVAAHAVMHARIHNRDSRTLEAMRSVLPPEAGAVIDDSLDRGRASLVMGAARASQEMDTETFASHARGEQKLMLQAVGLGAQDYTDKGGLAARLAPVRGLAETAQAVEGADSSHNGIKAANRAVMGMHPFGGTAPHEALGLEIARTRIEERENQVSGLMNTIMTRSARPHQSGSERD